MLRRHYSIMCASKSAQNSSPESFLVGVEIGGILEGVRTHQARIIHAAAWGRSDALGEEGNRMTKMKSRHMILHDGFAPHTAGNAYFLTTKMTSLIQNSIVSNPRDQMILSIVPKSKRSDDSPLSIILKRFDWHFFPKIS